MSNTDCISSKNGYSQGMENKWHFTAISNYWKVFRSLSLVDFDIHAVALVIGVKYCCSLTNPSW